jgi:hypothetical protein
MRHLKEVFSEAGIEVGPENRKEADRIIHELMGVGYKGCPHTWAAVKARLAEDRDGLIVDLRARWESNRK